MKKLIEAVTGDLTRTENVPTQEPVVLDEAAKEHTYSTYGHAVKKLVDKYAKHNAGNTSHAAAPDTSRFVAHSSGKIEYREHSQVHRPYGMDAHIYHHAVHIGTSYPKDKREAFMKEYGKIKHPTTSDVQQKDGSIQKHKIIHGSHQGTAYGVHGIRVGDKI